MPDSLTLPQDFELSLGAIAIAVLVLYAVRGFFRGIARLLFGMVALAIGAWVGYQVFVNGNSWLTTLLGSPPQAKTVLYAAWGAGGLAYAGLGLLGRNLGNRLGGYGKPVGPAGWTGALLSIVPSLFLVGVAAICIHWTGLVSDLDLTDRSVTAPDGAAKPDPDLFSRARRLISETWFGRTLQQVADADGKRVDRLASLLLLAKDEDAWKQVRSLPATAGILAHPRVEALLKDESVRRHLASSDLPRLVTDPEVIRVAEDPDVASRLAAIPVAELVDQTLYQEPASELGAGSVPLPRAVPVNPDQPEGASGQIPSADATNDEIPRAVPVRRRRASGPKRGAF